MAAVLVALTLAGCSDNGAGYRADLFCSPGTATDLVKLDRAELTAGAKDTLDECADHGSSRIIGLDARGLYVAGECCRYEWGNATVTAQFTVP